jgi:predicted outer membrane lipoprotein
MRLGKFIIEYHEALELIHRDSKDEFGRLVSIILHAIFSFYWALDNVSLAASFGIINIPEFEVSQSAMTIKFFGMALAAFFNLRTWIRLHHEELKARKMLKSLKGE